MTYSLNGIPLHEGHSGWRILRSGTNTQGGITKRINQVPVPGRPGYRPGPSTSTEQIIVFVVRTPKNRLEELLALCAAASVLSLTDIPPGTVPRQAFVELASAIPSSSAPFDATQDVTITLNAYEGVWRDIQYNYPTPDVFTPVTIASPVQTVYWGAGLSAPIYDGDFFLRGVFGEFQIVDQGSGSWIKTRKAWPGSSSTGLLWIGSTQQAFLANESSPWTPVADRSQYVDVSPHGGFRISPTFVSGAPSTRRAELQVTTLTQTNTTLRIRAKRAYRMDAVD